MKLLIFSLSIIFASYVHSIELKPGQWSTDSEVKVNGKVLDIQKKIDQALSMIPEAQRAQFIKVMEEQMGGNGLISGMATKSMCLTKEMTKDPLSFMNKQKECKGTPIKNEAKLKTYKVKCDNGANGLLTWNISDEKNYHGNFTGKSEKQEDIEVQFRGKFKQTKCL
tara:strand:- start:56940 stop:57440 length:501 start_codon:yes stop_codon:yes gene_type:complete